MKLKNVLDKEIDLSSSGEKYRKIADGLSLIFCFTIPVGLLATYHIKDFLGPGLGDNVGFHEVQKIISGFVSGQHWLTLTLFLTVIIGSVVIRSFAMYHAYYSYRKNNERYFSNAPVSKNITEADFPINHFFTYLGFNALLVLGMMMVGFVFAVIAVMLGYSFDSGFEFLKSLVILADQLIHIHIPTIVDLPRPIAFAAMVLLASFLHYWTHRLAHSFRILWLLLHRPHHWQEVLNESLTTGVIVAFPVGFLMMFPATFIFAGMSKLFSSEPLYMETILLSSFAAMAAVSAHHTALYHLGIQHKWLGQFMMFFGGGPHHYTHHSSAPVHSRYHTNFVNLSTFPAYIWDRVFGTYATPPAERPTIGLYGQPPIHLNPLRLLLAGILQIGYEWKHNRDFITRMKIIFCGSDYVPPVSKDYAVKST